MILVSAVKNVVSSVKALTGEIPEDEREIISDILKNEAVADVSIMISGDRKEAYIRAADKERTEDLSVKIEKETGIKAYFIADEKTDKGE